MRFSINFKYISALEFMMTTSLKTTSSSLGSYLKNKIQWNLDITNLYNKVLGIANSLLNPNNSKIYEKEPRYNETSLQRTDFASPLALRYMEVPLYHSLN